MNIYWLGRAAYEPTAVLQERLRARVLAGGAEALLLCEHEPVVTLGRSARPEEAAEERLRAAAIARSEASRGGRATYHGPGQLVAYPIVFLRRGVLAHVQALGEAAAQVARNLGVPAHFSRHPVGVYVGERKLAAIGVNVRRRVAIHGLALNVTAEACAPARRGLLIPCGEPQRALTSLAEEHPPGGALSVAALAAPLAAALLAALGRAAAPAARGGCVQAASTDSLLCQLDGLK